MRLIRLASINRKLSMRPERTEEDLARRLQHGLPESTYARAEAFFSRQAQGKQYSIPSSTASLPSRAVSKVSVQPPVDEDVHVRHKRGRSDQDYQQYKDDYRPTKYTTRPAMPEQRRPVPLGVVGSKLLAVQEEIAGLSPQSIAVAALIGHRGPTQTNDNRSPLTPSRVYRTSKGDRDYSNERMAVKATAPAVTPEKLSTESSGSKAETSFSKESSDDATTSTYAKPFAFRREDAYAEQASSRIIDRRRARNEDMRRKYMQKRVELQRAREAKLQKMAADTETMQSEPTQTSSVDTPISISSQTSSGSAPRLASPPASLRNLLNRSPDSA